MRLLQQTLRRVLRSLCGTAARGLLQSPTSDLYAGQLLGLPNRIRYCAKIQDFFKIFLAVPSHSTGCSLTTSYNACYS